MSTKLKGHEVVSALLGVYIESTGNNLIRLKERTTFYECIYELCSSHPEEMFDFEFRRRSGFLTSPDVDLCIRNLEDSKDLICNNPDLVDFQCTKTMKNQYQEKLKPKLENLGLLAQFEEVGRKICPPLRDCHAGNC